MIGGYAELEFDLPAALLDAILKKLDGMHAVPLTSGNTATIPEEQGVYALYLKNEALPVYIGKTDGEAGLKHRLRRHARKLIGRKNIDPDQVLFKAIRLYVFTAMDMETALIKHFGGVNEVKWNHSGFGSNDPGVERDTTRYKSGHFDTEYPIELDKRFVDFEVGEAPVALVMQSLKANLPYLLRFERPNPKSAQSFHDDFLTSKVFIARSDMTTREVVAACVTAMPTGWHATSLPSHIIVYKNDSRHFPSGHLIARS
jgi:hypothetical protein